MRFGRGVLWVSALVWAGFGVMLLVWPHRLGGVGLVVDSALARIEVRGVYGGLELAIAGVLAWSTRRDERVESGLVLSMVTLIGMASGRMVGIALESFSTTTQMWTFVAMELSGGVLSAVALLRLRRAR